MDDKRAIPENAFVGSLPADTLGNVRDGLEFISEFSVAGHDRLELPDGARTGLYLMTKSLIDALEWELSGREN